MLFIFFFSSYTLLHDILQCGQIDIYITKRFDYDVHTARNSARIVKIESIYKVKKGSLGRSS